MAAEPPRAFVVDLTRSPSSGRDLALWLRQRAATRHVPLVFAGGDEDKVRAIRTLLPDATYCDWRGIAKAVRATLRQPVAEHPVAPGPMAGYAGAPLVKKLGIRAGSTLALLGASKGFETTLGVLPPEVECRRDTRRAARTVLLFARAPRDLERRFPTASRGVAEGGALWVLWPKRGASISSDLTQAAVRAFGLAAGWVDYKIASIDATWSGLCFARRRASPRQNGRPSK